MNSYERIMTTFRHEEPDRIPITELGINPNVFRALGANSLYDFQLKIGYDLIIIRMQYRRHSIDGDYFFDELGVRFKDNNQVTPYPIEGPIKTVHDMDKLILPSTDDPYRFNYLEQAVKDLKGERAICYSTRAMFLWATELCSMEKLLTFMVTDPEFVDELLDKILDNQIQVVLNAIKMGADFILDTDDYGFNTGPLMSPKMFDRFITPRIKRFVDAVHAAGAKLIKHSDGDVNRLLDSLVAAGIDGLHSIDSKANMDLATIKKKYGDKITLIGNVDCGNLLAFGTEEDVKKEVKNCIRIAGPGGGYVLSTSNTLPLSVKPENYQAMVDCAMEFGSYPIAL